MAVLKDIPDAEGMDELPPKPQPPRDEDCCRSDCPNCVFTLYERELERWEERVAAQRARQSPPDPS
jgi:hypothetical protein